MTTNCSLQSMLVNFVKRLIAFMGHQTRKIMAQSFILAHSSITALYCGIFYICGTNEQNGKIQERTLRFITDDYSSSYEKLPNDSNTSTMAIKRVHSLCTEIFKSLNNLNAPYMKDLFHRNVSTYSLKSSNDLLVPRVNQTTKRLLGCIA